MSGWVGDDGLYPITRKPPPWWAVPRASSLTHTFTVNFKPDFLEWILNGGGRDRRGARPHRPLALMSPPLPPS